MYMDRRLRLSCEVEEVNMSSSAHKYPRKYLQRRRTFPGDFLRKRWLCRDTFPPWKGIFFMVE
jgi:hypothetical protein